MPISPKFYPSDLGVPVDHADFFDNDSDKDSVASSYRSVVSQGHFVRFHESIESIDHPDHGVGTIEEGLLLAKKTVVPRAGGYSDRAFPKPPDKPPLVPYTRVQEPKSHYGRAFFHRMMYDIALIRTSLLRLHVLMIDVS